MNIKVYPNVQGLMWNSVLFYIVRYADGCTVKFPYDERGKVDAELFIGVKAQKGEVVK